MQRIVNPYRTQAVFLLAVAISFTSLSSVSAQGLRRARANTRSTTPQAVTPRAPAPRPVLTRIFFQDDESRTVKWADVLDGNPPTLSAVNVVPGFPKLDAERQKLVHMLQAQGKILVGVRDDADGQFQSGWVLIETGVFEEDHGDHSHWKYDHPPRVRATQLDDQQGNPAHLYTYRDVFYLANDKLDGYTRLDPAKVGEKDDEARIRSLAGFHKGGGGHISLAVTDSQIGYSTWIDRSGDAAGRVDVTAIKPGGNTQIAYSLQLPSGGLHGATTNQGKVFFAPADGICWISASSNLSVDPKSVQIHHISLGEVDGKPVRTGGFTNFEKYVLFSTGSGADAALNLLDASAASPQVIRVPIKMAEGNRPSGLSVLRPRRGSPLAYVFHDHAAEDEAPNLLTIIELDPNGDGNFADARIAQTLEVGQARVEGHGGHHSIDFDADLRRAVFSNSGDGTLTLFSIALRAPITTFPVGGTPSRVITLGGRASSH